MSRKIIAHKLEFKKGFWRQWRWRIRANNGKIVDASTESFKNRADAVTNAKSTAASINKYFRDGGK